MVSLTNMTLNNVILPPGESVYQDSNGTAHATPEMANGIALCGWGP